MLLTLDQVFVGQCRFLLPQDSNAPTMCLTAPHFKTNTPMGAQIGASTFVTWALGVKITSALVGN